MALIVEIFVLWLRIVGIFFEACFRRIVPPTPKNLKGKLVLITGAGKGIGRALALEFARQGARLALWDIDEKGNQETASKAEELGAEARAYVCDVTRSEKVKDAATQVRADLGDVDILVNNAGIMVTKYLLDLSEAEIRRNFEINTIAHFWTVKEFLPAMLMKDAGNIVNVSSMAGIFGVAMLTDYCAAKFGVVGFSEALQAEMHRLKKDGIHVSVVCPKGVNTNLLSSIAHRAQYKDRFGSVLEADDVAKMIVNGVRRNAPKIYCPEYVKNAKFWTELMPVKAQVLLNDFAEAGLFPVKEGKGE